MAYYYPPPVTVNVGILNSSFTDVPPLTDEYAATVENTDAETPPLTETVGIVNS